jgi:hypothetical protein
VLEVFSEFHELDHGLALELLHVLMLLLELLVALVLKGAQFERLVGPLRIDLLLQVVLVVVHLLHYVLFSFDTGLYFRVELVLQAF